MRVPLMLLLTACGPIYGNQQPSQQQPPQPSYQQGPPGGAADPDPWQSSSGNPPPRPTEPAQPAEPARPAPESTAPAAMQTILNAHNAVRAKHCAQPLAWSPKLAAAAQDWANSLKAQGCKFGHKPRNEFGENLAAGTSGTLDGQAVANMWYEEIKLYRFPGGGFSMQTGHFTQVVWRETTQLGCGVSTCNGMDIWVCEYDPPGNVDTMYRANVLPTGCR